MDETNGINEQQLQAIEKLGKNFREAMPIDEIKKSIKETMAKMGDKLTIEEKKGLAKGILRIFEEGMPPMDALAIPKEQIAHLYGYAYNIFSKGDYVGAREIFKVLLMLDPMTIGFAVSLGVCHQRLKDYELALMYYMYSAMMNPEDPVPLFYAYDCFLKTDDEVSAGIMLANVIQRCGDHKKYAVIKEKAQHLFEELEAKILGGKKP